MYVVAASRNMMNAPEAGLPWARGNGCVGILWDSGKEYLFADLREGLPPSEDQYGLTKRQQDLTGHVKCVVSVAIYQDLGAKQHFVGIINVESGEAAATDRWIENGNVSEPLIGLLRQFAIYVAEHSLLT